MRAPVVALALILAALAGCLAEPGVRTPADDGPTDEVGVPLPGAVITTPQGEIKLVLYPERMPETVANFRALVERGFYNGSLFDRVVDNFVIQGGENPGGHDDADTLPLETHPDLYFASGTLGMARELDPDSATSVFFIDEYPQPHLRDPEPGASLVYGEFAAFGQVVDGMSVVRAIAEVPVDETDRPREDVPMQVRLATVHVPERVADALPLKTWGRETAPPYRVSLESAGTLHAGDPAPYLAWFVESRLDRTADTNLDATMRVVGPDGTTETVDLRQHPEDGNIHLSDHAFPAAGDHALTFVADGRDLVTFTVHVDG